VALALALDPSERLASAAEMSRAVGAGARGLALSTVLGSSASATVAASPPSEATQATTLLPAPAPAPAPRPQRRGRSAPRPVEALTPRHGPPPEQHLPPVLAAARPPRRRGGRLVGWAIALGAVALAAIAVAFATAPEPTQVHLREVTQHDVSEAASALRELVSENTK
ncbi:MAG: hypothetical protein KGJ43_07540, partial [Acidobacteriota bacterium]|nr:hypothetical protein [Acidobacteriota bacterium]